MKVCFYAINGHGLGHLSRAYAVAKQLKTLSDMLSIEVDIQFLTTSEADYIIRDFPVFKIPSRANFKGRKAAASRYTANGKMMVCSMLSHFSPDILVMDTVAQGSFQEFNFIKDFAKVRVLIDRHKKSEYNGARIHRAHLPLFDKILVPDDQSFEADYDYEIAIKNRVHFVGRIHNFALNEAWTVERVREYFNVTEDQKLIYVSAGGGGDVEAEGQISHLLDALVPLNVKVIIGYGALSRAAKVYGREKVITLTESGVCKYFKGIDLAISAAGYNTYEELLAAKVNCLFFAQDKGMDLQERRVEQGMENGWHGGVELTRSKEEIRDAVSIALANDVSPELVDRVYSQGDCFAASELLSSYFAGNVDRKINSMMAKTVMLLYSSGEIETGSIVSSYQLWKLFICHLEGKDAWYQRCINASSIGGTKKDNQLISEFKIISEIELQLDRVEFSSCHKNEFIKYICNLGEQSLVDLVSKSDMQKLVENYLTEKNHVE